MSVGCFFFQAEDGIRDHCVTGVQTCALPISYIRSLAVQFVGIMIENMDHKDLDFETQILIYREIGRASCRERV